MIRAIVRDEVRAAFAALPIASSAAGVGSAEYVTDVQLADWLSMSRETIQQWRSRGDGPPFVKIGRAVRYHLPAVRTWIALQRS